MRPAVRGLAVVGTTHHVEGLLSAISALNQPIELVVAHTGSDRARNALGQLHRHTVANSLVTVTDELLFSVQGWPLDGRWIQYSRFHRRRIEAENQGIQLVITPYPYRPLLLTFSVLMGANRAIIIDDGTSTPLFTGLRRDLTLKQSQMETVDQALSPRMPVEISPPSMVLTVRRLLRWMERGIALPLLDRLRPRFFTEFPLHERRAWRMERRSPPALPFQEADNWVLVIGAPWEQTVGEARADEYRLGLIHDSLLQYPSLEVVYLGHPLERDEWPKRIGYLLCDRVTLTPPVADWRGFIESRGSLPVATYSACSTLAYTLAWSSEFRIRTHIGGNPACSPNRSDANRWKSLQEVFLALYVERFGAASTVLGVHSYEILGANECETKRMGSPA